MAFEKAANALIPVDVVCPVDGSAVNVGRHADAHAEQAAEGEAAAENRKLFILLYSFSY